MEKNKVTTYLLYAIGEILLVVIGIMIAVSLNNWNDDRKAILQEQKSLAELQSALRADLVDIQFNISWHESAKNACEILLKVYEEKTPYHDSLGNHFGSMGRFSQFLPELGTYESIKSNGIGLISDDSLRIKIAHYYENEIKYALGNEEINRSLLPFDFELFRKHFYVKELVSYAVPIDYKALMQDESFRSYLYSTRAFRSLEEEMFRELEKSCQNLIDRIEEELKNEV